MRLPKLAATAILTLSAGALLVPGSVFASSAKAKVETGSISVYNPGSDLTINGVDIKLTKHTRLVAEDAAAQSAGLAAGDAAAAFIRWHKGAAVAKRVEFGTADFAFRNKSFSGRYSTSTDTPSTVTILVHKASLTFTTDANTKYFDDGQSVTAPNYLPNERISVRGEEFTSGSWYAMVVRLRHGKHKNH